VTTGRCTRLPGPRRVAGQSSPSSPDR
jgi:hypothetical protein